MIERVTSQKENQGSLTPPHKTKRFEPRCIRYGFQVSSIVETFVQRLYIRFGCCNEEDVFTAAVGKHT